MTRSGAAIKLWSMRNFWIYTAARLGIIVVVGLILWPFMGLTLMMGIAAIIIGAILSYVFLGSLRSRVAGDIDHRLANRSKKRSDPDEDAEDKAVDNDQAVDND